MTPASTVFLHGLWAFRSFQKALLSALLTPAALLKELQDENRMTELMMMQEELKLYPLGDVWNEYCRQCGVESDQSWFEKVKIYEKDVLSQRK